MINELKSIKTWKEYERYKICEDIKGYLGNFKKDIFGKIKTPEDLITVCCIIIFISLFT